jgi:mRNA-degrading endonuclease RelE of RelBE toxin-antitoxin system
MSHFKQLPEFEKELKRLSKKYPTLHQDIKDLEDVLRTLPTGSGKNFTIIHHSEKVKLVKTRLACKSLKNRAMRVIYAYHNETVTFVYIELYFKGNKANEDRERIFEYLESV